MLEHMKGAIFDLDGVIVDTAKYHYLAWRSLAADSGCSLRTVWFLRMRKRGLPPPKRQGCGWLGSESGKCWRQPISSQPDCMNCKSLIDL